MRLKTSDRAQAAAMNATQAEQSQVEPTRVTQGRRSLLVLAALAVLGGLFAGVPSLLRRSVPKPAPQLSIHSRPQGLPNLQFLDGQGRPTSLPAFHGRVVLLNVWATWCTPCREEMPTLDRLQAMLGGPDFEVVALSIDRSGMPAVEEFFLREGIQHLRPYLDASAEAPAQLGAVGIPLTLLIDRRGREIGRKLGPAAWDDQKVVEMIRSHMAAESAQPRAASG